MCVCVWCVRGVCVVCSWCVHGVCVVCAWCVRGVCMFAWCCDSEIYSDGVSIYLHVCVCVGGCVCGENLCRSEKQLDRERPRVKRVKETMRVRIGTKRMCVCRHKCVCSSE